MANSTITLSKAQARRIWLHAQKLDTPAPFGNGPQATPAVVRHLGYVQIDTIHVIERCHHHILYSRIPQYRREHLHQAQALDKSVFEYWGHALAYIPTADFRFHVRDMRSYAQNDTPWLRGTKDEEVRRMLARIRKNGALTIRDIDDDVLVEKNHEWASRKELLPVAFEGSGKTQHWATPELLATVPQETGEWVHILSPFDPLIIQRKRLELFFDYQHRFEAYVPKEKRVFGYFACPVLCGDQGRARLRASPQEAHRERTARVRAFPAGALAAPRPRASRWHASSCRSVKTTLVRCWRFLAA
jgi:uncharacterized protein YcaQ